MSCAAIATCRARRVRQTLALRERVNRSMTAAADGFALRELPAAHSRLVLAEAPLRRAVMILQRDQQSFHRPQRTDRNDKDERQPQSRVYPQRRLVDDFSHQRGEDDNEAGEKRDEHGGPVARIGETVIEAADLAAPPQRAKAL